MKKSLIYGMLAVVGASLTGCNDFLDDNRWPLDKQSNNPAYWSNSVNVQGQIDQIYNNFYGYGNAAGRNGTFYFQSLSDDQVGIWGSSVEFNTWNNLQTPGTASVWNSTYQEIRHINSIIEGVESGSLAEDVDGKNFIGIAKMNRAWQYYDLVRHYGDVPLVLTVLDPVDHAALYGPRTPRNEVMDQALEDINYAIKNITTASSKIAFSRDLAYAIKAEICLYEASMAKYHQKDNARATKFYGEVVKACEALMAGGYELEPEYGTIYNSVWEATSGMPSLQASPEVIFMKGYKISVLQHSLVKYTNIGEILGMSKDAFDSYLFLDGKPMSMQDDKNDEGVIPVYHIT
ncbi:MAG: RagB/SusD family nutrient uptake outer membrane protein, partial [Muribaculaceae bacterium]|nr:RagB/SusD family nutrient uptake outer membrane protein [Muribaculaceae bacterium]